MDFGTIKSHVTRNLGGDQNITTFVEQWINNCYLDLITMGRFPELKRFAPIPCPDLDDTTTWYTEAELPDYPVATNSLFPVSLRDITNDKPLKMRGIRWYDRHRSITSGQPRIYAPYGGRYYLEPMPDDVYGIQERFRKKVSLPALSSDTDVPVIGQQWHEAIEIGATYRGARSLSQPTANAWLADLKTFMIAHSEESTEEEEDADIGFSIEM